jgi:phosphoribosylformylglycinamidine synthase
MADNLEAAPPPVFLDAEKRHGDFLRQQIAAGSVSAAHDISDGGLLSAVAEMAMASDGGAEIIVPEDGNLHGWCFGEDQGRYVVATADAEAFLRAANAKSIPVQVIGSTLDQSQLQLSSGDIISVEQIKNAYEGWFPELMAADSKAKGG